jgi:hypothetical protein
MKLSLSRGPIFVVLVIAGLAAGTALVAGYVDKPDQAAPVCAEDQCGGCPMAGTDLCPMTADSSETPPWPTLQKAGEGEPAGCCPNRAQAVCCPMMADPAPTACPKTAGEGPTCCPMRAGQESQAESSCGAGGCTQAE